MNLNECLEKYIEKLNESIALGKPFSKITKKDVLNYLNLGYEDGQYRFANWGNTIYDPKLIKIDNDQINDLKKDGGIDECVNFIRGLQFPLKIYRGVVLKDDDDLDMKNIGNHWTVNPRLFFGHDTSLKCCNDEEDITHVIIGKINNQDDIDLGQTLSLYAENSAGDYAKNWDETEDEVFIPDTSKIKILAAMPFEDFKRSRMRY